MKEKNILHKILIYLNILFSFLLLIIYISLETDPTKYGYFSLLSLLYSPVLLINLIFIIYWVIIKKSYFLLPLISILIGYEHIPKQIQFFGENKKNKKNNVKIISFNTRKFVHNGWDVFLSPKGRIEVIIGATEAKLLAEAVFDVKN